MCLWSISMCLCVWMCVCARARAFVCACGHTVSCICVCVVRAVVQHVSVFQLIPHVSSPYAHAHMTHALYILMYIYVNVHSQKEIPSMEDIIDEERIFFLRTDTDGDTKLSKAEFVKHFIESLGDFSGVNTSMCVSVCACVRCVCVRGCNPCHIELWQLFKSEFRGVCVCVCVSVGVGVCWVSWVLKKNLCFTETR